MHQRQLKQQLRSNGMSELFTTHRSMLDSALDLAMRLIAIPSVTPAGIDVMDVVSRALGARFVTEYFFYNGNDNSLACSAKFDLPRDSKKHLCFAGHLDVVPEGTGWSTNPFSPVVKDGMLYGRGAVDMKSAVACFVSALLHAIDHNENIGHVSVILTGDEESGPSSMSKIVDNLMARGFCFDLCVVGEPTSELVVGDTIKVGRRGSCNFNLLINGQQGHVGYPDNCVNPIYFLPRALEALQNISFDSGNEWFQPSHLVITNVDSSNTARNMVPGSVSVLFNVRFNPINTADYIIDRVRSACDLVLGDYSLTYNVSSLPFISDKKCSATDIVESSITNNTAPIGTFLPKFSTSGGTSDARFLYKLGPIAELGLLNKTAHSADEYVSIDDISKLTMIYFDIICKFFQE